MISFDLHIGWIVLGGLALLAMTTLPRLFERRPLSLPIVYVSAGYLAFAFSDSLIGPRPLGDVGDAQLVEYGAELIVIVSLAAAGLKLDRRIGLVSWASVWRLLAVTMTLTVLATVALGAWGLGLSLGAAILLGAVLAPTDPVLADDVQVPEPGADHDSEIRFTLTAEAGLNDALAFPLTHLAIAVIAAGGSVGAVMSEWLAIDVGYRLAVGAASGWALGQILLRFSRIRPGGGASSTAGAAFVLGATLLVYGLTEIINGYGFLAVFVAALSGEVDDVRHRISGHADELERMILAFVLLAFGALIAEGILDALTWSGAAVAVALVLVIRPVAGYLGLVGSPLPTNERLAISFYGIRGMGTIFYLAYAANHADIAADELATVWAVAACTIVVSVVVHGVSATPAMRRLDC